MSWPLQSYPNDAVVYYDQVLNDTSQWVTIQGVYIPDSAYSHLAIGNFFENSLSDAQVLDSTGTLSGSYAFIDEVCVSLTPADCPLVNDLSDNEAHTPRIYPNPFTDRLSIEAPFVTQGALELFNAFGQLVYASTVQLSRERVSVPLPELPPGAYILLLDLEDQGRQRVMLIRE